MRERGLPLSAVVVDLAQREVQVALRALVRGAVSGRDADAVRILVVLGR